MTTAGAAGQTVIVDDRGDRLATGLAAALAQRGDRVRHLAAAELAAVPVEIGAGGAFVHGEPVSTVIFRASPATCFSESFVEPDGDFCTNETRASWLAMLQLPGVVALNRPDAELWYAISEWSHWRRRLRAAGVPLAPLAVGAVDEMQASSWLPWGGGIVAAPGAVVRRTFATAVVDAVAFRQSVWCYGQIISGIRDAATRAAADVLTEHGIGLGAVISDADGRVVCCTSQPRIPESLVALAVALITETLDARRDRR